MLCLNANPDLFTDSLQLHILKVSTYSLIQIKRNLTSATDHFKDSASCFFRPYSTAHAVFVISNGKCYQTRCSCSASSAVIGVQWNWAQSRSTIAHMSQCLHTVCTTSNNLCNTSIQVFASSTQQEEEMHCHVSCVDPVFIQKLSLARWLGLACWTL